MTAKESVFCMLNLWTEFLINFFRITKLVKAFFSWRLLFFHILIAAIFFVIFVVAFLIRVLCSILLIGRFLVIVAGASLLLFLLVLVASFTIKISLLVITVALVFALGILLTILKLMIVSILTRWSKCIDKIEKKSSKIYENLEDYNGEWLTLYWYHFLITNLFSWANDLAIFGCWNCYFNPLRLVVIWFRSLMS